MANQDSTLPTAPTDVCTDDFDLSYDVLSLRASLRAATIMLESLEGYGNRDVTGEGMCDVGFLLHDAEDRLDHIHKKVDALEGACAQIKYERKTSEDRVVCHE
ncbi:MAG: hypothetical protein KJ958_14790 [Gammaproteobacteria bacterium]|nr:hypothetical protein [Gammaproteobacteria bacterium]